VPRLIAHCGLGGRRRVLAGHKERISETKSRGEPEKCNGQKKDFPENERMDAD
jgi:hypothetical protein